MASGEITRVTDANGLAAEAVFGRFGRKVAERNSTGSYSETRVYEGTGGYCEYPTQYHIVTTSADGSQGFICYDPLGRETKKGKLGFRGYEWYITRTGYDRLGNVRFKTLPYTEYDETPQWIANDYDRLGRKTKTRFPDGTSETLDYQLYDTVFTNRLGDARWDEKNALGELIKTTDALGGTITYTYDAAGNTLTTTTDGPDRASGITGPITVAMTYGPDAHARWKTSMNDPDKGHWQYRYNAFGEVIEQIDARGRSTVTHRDILGREVCRVDYLDTGHTAVESSSAWFYDTAPTPDNGNGQTNAIGKLHRVVKSASACTSTPEYRATAEYPYEQVLDYDAHARNHQTRTVIDGETFTTRVTYDGLGRVFQTFDAAGNNRGTRNVYNDQGYLSEIRDAQTFSSAQPIYRKILAMDARGKVTQEFGYNGMTTTRTYDPLHGMITSIHTALEGVLTAQDLVMTYDALGNLLRRDDNKRERFETFCYDALNRMTGSALDAECTGSEITYDSFGNFIDKLNAGNYTYGENAGPHAVTATEKDGVITTYRYDANGNMTGDSTGRTLIYSQFDKPVEIAKGDNRIRFDYGPGRARYKRVDTDGEGNTTTTLYLGNVEIIERNGVREAKRHIAGNTLSTETDLTGERTSVSPDLQFIFRDHLGSTDIILTETPTAAEGQTLMSFDA